MRFIEAIKFLVKEHAKNIKKIFQIGIAHAKRQTLRTSLGLGWVFTRDIIYFSAFTVFRYLMSGSREVEGINFIVYIITGIVPWNFMSEVLSGASGAIKSNITIIKNISFPISIIPTFEVVAVFYRRLFTLIIPFVIILIFGDIMLFNPLLYIYYFLSMFILMIVLNFTFSAIIAISADFQQLYLALVRILFFLMPILWSFERIVNYPTVEFILKLNPMVYIITGFRDAFVHNVPPSLNYSLYFWAIIIILFTIGSYFQYKMRKYYADFM